jgi:hypothetical protein
MWQTRLENQFEEETEFLCSRFRKYCKHFILQNFHGIIFVQCFMCNVNSAILKQVTYNAQDPTWPNYLFLWELFQSQFYFINIVESPGVVNVQSTILSRYRTFHRGFLKIVGAQEKWHFLECYKFSWSNQSRNSRKCTVAAKIHW